MLFNDVIVTSSTIEYQLVYNYVDRGRISIPTKLQTNTPNNKEVAGGGGGFGPPGQRSAKNSPA